MSYYCGLLVEGLAKAGHEVSVVSKQGLLAASRPGLRRRLLSKTPAVLSTWPHLLALHFKYPDSWIVNISQEYIPPFAASRSINIIHDLIQIDYPRSRPVQVFYRHLLPRLARSAALNISVSKFTAAQLAMMRVDCRVVYNEFKITEVLQPAAELPARQYAGCWVGNLSLHKNFGDYVSAAAAMPEAMFAAVMPRGDAHRAAMKFKLPANLALFHSLSTADYTGLLGASRFLVSTSLLEGFGRPPADGALAGCDIALSDTPIYRELYDGLAHFYAPGDVTGLVAILSEMPTNIYLRATERFKQWAEQYNLIGLIHEKISRAS
jgi:glycosyltransferase involved in cell wall biosynthesis